MSRERRVFDATCVVLASAASSQLPALAAVVTERLGREPSIRVATLAAALGAAGLTARSRGSGRGRAWPWALAPLALVFFGPFLDLLAWAASAVSGPAARSALELGARVVAGLAGGASLGAVLGVAASVLARSKRGALFFASFAAMIALVPDGPRAIGGGLGAVALAAWLVRRHGEREAPAIEKALLAFGLAGLVALAPVGARLLVLQGSSPALLALCLALGLALGARIGRAPALALAAPALALLALVLAPRPIALAALALGAAAASGLALRAWGAHALALAVLLGAGLESGFFAAAERAWDPATKVRFAGGDGDRLQYFALGAGGAVAVVDTTQGNTRALYRDGVLLGSVAIGKGETQADVATPVLVSVLAELLGRAGGHVACLGFGEGIAAATLDRAGGLSDLWLVEPDERIRAIADDPGDLFHRAWQESAATVVPEDARSFLRRQTASVDAIVDLEGALADAGALAVARNRLAPGAALVRIVRDGPSFASEARDFAHAFPGALAFRAPRSRGNAILVGGVSAIDSARALGSRIAAALSLARIHPGDLLGAFSGGRDALRAARRADDLVPSEADVKGLAGLLGSKDILVAVAESALRFEQPRTARAVIQGARALGASPPSELDRVEGDARFAEGADDDAVRLWNHAVVLDETALAPRLSLAGRLMKRKELEAARKLLEGALSGEPGRDAPAHYLLGMIAFNEKDFPRARSHFEAASGFQNATDMIEVVSQVEKQAGTPTPATPDLPPSPQDKDAKRLLREGKLILEDALEKQAKLEATCKEKGLTVSDEQEEEFHSRREEAKELLELAAAKDPEDPAIHVELGHAKHALRDLQGAADEYALAARLDPGASRPYYLLGDALRELHQNDSALEAYERGLARGPISSATARVYLACADILVAEKRFDDAARELETAERADIGHPHIPANLGAIYERLGRKGDALRAYRRYFDLVGDAGDPALASRIHAAIARLEAEH